MSTPEELAEFVLSEARMGTPGRNAERDVIARVADLLITDLEVDDDA